MNSDTHEIVFPSDWIRIFGPDAKDFLHRLTTADFRNLLPTEATPGFFLTAAGKIRAGFYAYCVLPGEYLFRVPTSPKHPWVENLLGVIDQFTFSEKLTVERITPVWVRDTLGETTSPEGALRIQWGERMFGIAWITDLSITPGSAAPPPHSRPALTVEELDRLRIEALSPNWNTEIEPDANPLELGLTTFVAENKGCYPGQEVIEKIISLGSPARRLALLKRIEGIEGRRDISRIGDPVILEGATVGSLTSVTSSGEFALAPLRRNALASKVLVSGQTDESRADWELVRF